MALDFLQNKYREMLSSSVIITKFFMTGNKILENSI